jgi:hypothetical protein
MKSEGPRAVSSWGAQSDARGSHRTPKQSPNATFVFIVSGDVGSFNIGVYKRTTRGGKTLNLRSAQWEEAHSQLVHRLEHLGYIVRLIRAAPVHYFAQLSDPINLPRIGIEPQKVRVYNKHGQADVDLYWANSGGNDCS